MDGKDIIAFTKNGEKFANCASFTEVTSQVTCKVTSGWENTLCWNSFITLQAVDGVAEISLTESGPSQGKSWQKCVWSEIWKQNAFKWWKSK